MTNRAVMPPGEARPLHVMMAELLNLSGLQVPHDPIALFDWMSREVSVYNGVDYESIGVLGAMLGQPVEVLR